MAGWDPVWGDRCQQLVWIGVRWVAWPLNLTGLFSLLSRDVVVAVQFRSGVLLTHMNRWQKVGGDNHHLF